MKISFIDTKLFINTNEDAPTDSKKKCNSPFQNINLCKNFDCSYIRETPFKSQTPRGRLNSDRNEIYSPRNFTEAISPNTPKERPITYINKFEARLNFKKVGNKSPVRSEVIADEQDSVKSDDSKKFLKGILKKGKKCKYTKFQLQRLSTRDK